MRSSGILLSGLFQECPKAKGVDTVTRHMGTKERQPQAMSELWYHQPNRPAQQDHAPSHPPPTQDKS